MRKNHYISYQKKYLNRIYSSPFTNIKIWEILLLIKFSLSEWDKNTVKNWVLSVEWRGKYITVILRYANLIYAFVFVRLSWHCIFMEISSNNGCFSIVKFSLQYQQRKFIICPLYWQFFIYSWIWIKYFSFVYFINSFKNNCNCYKSWLFNVHTYYCI